MGAKSKLAGAFCGDTDQRGTSSERPPRGSLLSGVGMMDYSLELAGYETAFHVEIDPYGLAALGAAKPGWALP